MEVGAGVMAVFNRLVAVIVALAVFAGAIITLLVTAGAVTPGVLPYKWFESSLQRAADTTSGSAAAIIIVGVAVALCMIVLLLLEVIPLRKRVSLLIRSTGEGVTTIDKESVRVLAERTAAAVNEVRDAKCDVDEMVGGLFISCWARLSIGCNVPEISAELQNKVKEAVEGFTGLPVAQVDVKVAYESMGARRPLVR